MTEAPASAACTSTERIALIEIGMSFSSIVFPACTFRTNSSILPNPLWYLGEERVLLWNTSGPSKFLIHLHLTAITTK